MMVKNNHLNKIVVSIQNKVHALLGTIVTPHNLKLLVKATWRHLTINGDPIGQHGEASYRSTILLL